jgi:hypothetical protein
VPKPAYGSKEVIADIGADCGSAGIDVGQIEQVGPCPRFATVERCAPPAVDSGDRAWFEPSVVFEHKHMGVCAVRDRFPSLNMRPSDRDLLPSHPDRLVLSEALR